MNVKCSFAIANISLVVLSWRTTFFKTLKVFANINRAGDMFANIEKELQNMMFLFCWSNLRQALYGITDRASLNCAEIKNFSG